MFYIEETVGPGQNRECATEQSSDLKFPAQRGIYPAKRRISLLGAPTETAKDEGFCGLVNLRASQKRAKFPVSREFGVPRRPAGEAGERGICLPLRFVGRGGSDEIRSAGDRWRGARPRGRTERPAGCRDQRRQDR